MYKACVCFYKHVGGHDINFCLIVFLDAGLSNDEEILELCYESLKELFPEPGAKTLILRSKVWKVISSASMVSHLSLIMGSLFNYRLTCIHFC